MKRPDMCIAVRTVIAVGLAVFLYLALLLCLNDTAYAQGQRPPSLVLIEEAFQRGELDYETALLYKVYTLFAPERLPARFRSDTPGRSATMILVDVYRNRHTLNPHTRALLSEFIAPPRLLAPSAVQAQSRPLLTDEQTLTTTHFVVHYTVTGTDAVYEPDVDVNPANGVPDYVDWVAEDVETVWQMEIGAMGWLEPPPDTGEGGDTRYDLYLKHIPLYYGYTDYADGFLGDNPNSPLVTETKAYYSYVVLENDFSSMTGDKRDLVRVTLAHEFNHAIQLGTDATEAVWLMEATATWIEDEVYDGINDNYPFLRDWFENPDTALDLPDLQAYFYGYARWIFMRYVSEHHGGQATVRSMWEHAVALDSMDAVNAALAEAGTDFETVFSRFAAANYVLSSLPQNAPYVYEEADGYRSEVGGVEIEAYLPFTGSLVSYDSFVVGNGHLENHSAEYWVISATASFSMVFNGNSGIDYAVLGALRQGDRVTVREVSLIGKQGTLVVYNPASYDQVVIIVANTGSISETSGYGLSFRTTTQVTGFRVHLPLVLRGYPSWP